METDILQQVITGAPNFIFALVAIIALLKRLNSQDKLIVLLVGKWAECEDNEEKRKMVDVLQDAKK